MPRVNAAGMGDMRQLSPDIWNDCNAIWQLPPSPAMGSYYFDDFTGPFDPTTTTGWTITQGGSAGSIHKTDNQHGVLSFDADDDDDDDGIQAQMISASGGEDWLVVAGHKLWFEALVRVNYIAAQYFIGLCDRATAIFTAGVLNETFTTPGTDPYNMIGFYFDGNTTSGYWEFVTAKAGSANLDTDVFGRAAGGVVAIVDEWMKLGFVAEEVDGDFVVKPYCKPCASASRDNVRGTWVTDTDDIPITADTGDMALSVVSQAEVQSSTNPEVQMDWVCIAQDC